MKRQRHSTLLGLAGSALLLLIGCGTTEPPQKEAALQETTLQETAPQEPSAAEATGANESNEAAETTDLRDRADEAKAELVKRLAGRLREAIAEGGIPSAIPVCKQEAPKIARDIGDELGLAIGRTSFRLRNPENRPPDWALPLVEQKVGEAQYVDLPDGGLGALLPIRLGPQCVACHGPAEQIGQEVQSALAENYPEDTATGFHAGDLRGWFWVEVPK